MQQNLEIRTNKAGERFIVDLDDLDQNGSPAIVQKLGKETKAPVSVSPKATPEVAKPGMPTTSLNAPLTTPIPVPEFASDLQKEAAGKAAPGTFMRNFTVESIPTVLGTLGGMAGGPLAPVASAAGYLGGAAIARELRDQLGIPQQSSGGSAGNEAANILTEGGSQFIADKLGEGVTTVLSKPLKQAFYRKMAERTMKGSNKLSPETMQLLREDPDMPITLGQAKGTGSLMDLGENLLRPEKKAAIIAKQQDKLQTKLARMAMERYPVKVNAATATPKQLETAAKMAERKTIFPEEFAREVRTQIQQGYESISGLEDKLWGDFRSKAGQVQQVERTATKVPNPNRPVNAYGQPTGPYEIDQVAEKVISAPVTPTVAKSQAKAYMDRIHKAYGTASAENLFPLLVDDQKQLYSALSRIANATGPMDLEVVTDLKRIAGKKGFKGSLPSGFDEASFRKLSGALDTDIQKSVMSWDLPEAQKLDILKDYKRANAVTEKKKKIFVDINEIENLRSSPLSGIGETDALFRDPNLLKRAIQASKDPGATRRALAAKYITDFQERVSSAGEFKPTDQILDLFKGKENATLSTLLPPKERVRLESLVKSIREMTEKMNAQGQMNLSVREGNAGFTLAADTWRQLFKDGEIWKSATSAGARQLAVIVGFREFIENVALNPQVSREVLQLAKTKPQSPQASKLAERVLLGLKGVRVLVQTPTGELPAVVGEDGKVQMVAPE